MKYISAIEDAGKRWNVFMCYIILHFFHNLNLKKGIMLPAKFQFNRTKYLLGREKTVATEQDANMTYQKCALWISSAFSLIILMMYYQILILIGLCTAVSYLMFILEFTLHSLSDLNCETMGSPCTSIICLTAHVGSNNMD